VTLQPIQLGPFELEAVIGRGGMAEVWRGVHAKQRTPVAVKVITASRAREAKFRGAFRNEVQAAARLHHPGIVLVLDHGEVGPEHEAVSEGKLTAGSPYLAMELASWGSLDRVRTPLPFDDIARMLLALLDALAHAHARGVIHRDLKPGNVLLAAPTDPRPGLKLTDFGIAHALEADQMGADSASSGTPHFMAPEQFMGQWRDYGPWTDLYAVGCLACVLATGTLPFQGEGAVQLAYAHLNLPPPTIGEGMPFELSGWIHRLMQKDPADRFQRAADAGWSLLGIQERWRASRTVQTSFADPTPTDPFTGPRVGGSAATAHPVEIAPTLLEDLPLERARGRPTEIGDRPSKALRTAGGGSVDLDDVVDTGDLATLVQATAVGATLPWFGEELAARFGADAPKLPSLSGDELATRRVPPLPSTWRRHDEGGSIELAGAGLGLYGLRAIPMVDREDERDEIWRALRDVKETRTPRGLVIRGAAGVGRSRLVEWMTERADEVGNAIVLRATHSPIVSPSDGLGRMLARHFRAFEMTRKEVLDRAEAIVRRLHHTGPEPDEYEWRALAELMQPAETGEVGALQFGSATERHLLVGRILERLARERPVIVWLEDVHLGADAIAFARWLLREAASPILVLPTVREEALDDRPAEASLLAMLESEVGARSIRLANLTFADQKRLVRELLVLDDELASEVAARTDGNPLFAVQLIGDWVQRGLLEVGPEGFVVDKAQKLELPDDIHGMWRRRIARVIAGRPGAEVALELAAALGTDVDRDEWSYVAEELQIDLPEGLLDVLIANRLAQPTEVGWVFSHLMLRESLIRSAKENGRYAEHHRACARMLQRRYDPDARGIPYRLGNHFVEAGDLEDALEPLHFGAIERLETSRYPEAQAALERLEEVLTRLGAGEEDMRWGEDWVLLARVATLQGRLQDAQALVEKAEARARRWGWRTVLPEALEVMGNIAHDRGDQAAAIDAYTKARELYVWNEDTIGVINCLFGLGEAMYRVGRHDESEAYYLEGLALAEERQHIRGMANHLLGLGFIALWRGDLAGALARFRSQLQLLENLGSRFRIARCVSALGEVARLSGNLEQAEAHYRRALTINEAIGSSRAWLDRLNLALVLLARSRFGEAREMIEAVMDDLGEAAEPVQRCIVHVELLPCLAEVQDWEAWDRHFLEATAMLRETRLKDGDVAWLLALAGERALAAGDPVRSRHSYELAILQWRALGRPDKAEEVEDAIALLRSMR
jgi:serine/threonine protein kinase/tetratricopeptide (TPR) repeat protein